MSQDFKSWRKIKSLKASYSGFTGIICFIGMNYKEITDCNCRYEYHSEIQTLKDGYKYGQKLHGMITNPGKGREPQNMK